MPRAVVDPVAVAQVRAALSTGVEPEQATLQRAVLHLLNKLSKEAPGRSIEVRVPPLGAAQCGEATGPTHRRGTPPNVVQLDPLTWVRLATGDLSWAVAIQRGLVSVSGVRADLSPWLPVERPAAS